MPKPKPITVIYKKPGEDAIVTTYEAGLAGMQKLVGGYIEHMRGDVVGLPRVVDLWFHEEGKLEGLTPNLDLVCNGTRFDVLVGPAFFTSNNGEGETISLPETYHQQVLDFCKAHTWRGH